MIVVKDARLLVWLLTASVVATSATATVTATNECGAHPKVVQLLDAINRVMSRDAIQIVPGISVVKETEREIVQNAGPNWDPSPSTLPCQDVVGKLTEYLHTRRVDVNITRVVDSSARYFKPRFSFGKNSFMTGFGLGFLAFGLKKLLLPIFIGAQIVKSILIAMFLPSILGSVGKLVGKGVTTFAQSSGSSNFGSSGSQPDTINDFDFNNNGAVGTTATGNSANAADSSDAAGSESNYNSVWTYPSASIGVLPYQDAYQAASSNSLANDYITSIYNRPTKLSASKGNSNAGAGSFYSKDKSQDFKSFQQIPASSHLLANYDPFYSPLLSRMDSVFKQLGYASEACRERLVCNMYRNPAKYAPFSNLVSAQLSRELNELRKPSNDNAEILRFFRYMKAAKDGQDGQECQLVYPDCTSPRAPTENAPMVATFNDINKLVQARSH